MSPRSPPGWSCGVGLTVGAGYVTAAVGWCAPRRAVEVSVGAGVRPRIGDEGKAITTTTRASRGRNSDCEVVRSQALKPGEALAGMVVGEVVESDAEGYAPGDLVHHDLGYREYNLVDPGNQALGSAGARSAELWRSWTCSPRGRRASAWWRWTEGPKTDDDEVGRR
ncbi:MAG: hypothetical protein V7706_19970 [Dietzia psychralcaliphila]